MGYLSKYFSCYYATQLSRFHFVIASTFLVIVCDRTWGCFSKSVFQNYQHGDSDDDDVDVNCYQDDYVYLCETKEKNDEMVRGRRGEWW